MSQPPNQPPPGPRPPNQPPPGPRPRSGSSAYQPDPRYGPDPRYAPDPRYPRPPYPQQPPQQQPPQQQPPPYPPRPHPSAETRRDVEAAWQARLELGLDFEEHIAAGLAERVEELAQQRAAELRREVEVAHRAEQNEQTGRGRQLALGIVSVVMGVPITAISGPAMDGSGLLPMAIAWTGIVGVNVAHAIGIRRRR